MAHKVARMLLFSLLLGLGFGLVDAPMPGSRNASGTATGTSLWASPTQPKAERVVFLAKNLVANQLVALSANLAASGHPGTLLLDSPKSTPFHKLFLQSYQPERVVPIGTFPEGLPDVEQRLGTSMAPLVRWRHGTPIEFLETLFPSAERVVVCPEKPYRQLLQAACLAGVLQAPLFVLHDSEEEARQLKDLCDHWKTQMVYVIGSETKFNRHGSNARFVRLADEEAVAASYLRHQLKRGPVRSLVVANPADLQQETGVMSPLAPWVALHKRAVLLCTNKAGDNVASVVNAAVSNRALERAENLILVADLKAIPMERRPNPIHDGKDPFIEMEPLTPTGSDPFTFATGRLFNDDPSVVPLVLARERLLADERHREIRGKRKALVVSNSAGGLPLLEAFSRNTAMELSNAGYETKTLFGSQVSKEELRRLLPNQDIFLWEGHHNTLIKEYAMPDWTEPLQPSLVFLQSCLALKDYKAQPLIERGALGVVGSSTRIYSASGGAFALSYFDALLYEHRSLGGSLRQAKNFLLAYSLLKEKRLGKDAKLGVANIRSAWAFSLWGDPTLRLPPPRTPDDALPPVTHQVRGRTIIVSIPDTAHERATTSKFRTEMWANGRLAGLLTKSDDDELQRLVPFLFAEVALPSVPAGKTPRLSSQLPSKRWIFCWDARRRAGYLLITPRAKDRDEIRFHIDWEPSETAQAEERAVARP